MSKVWNNKIMFPSDSDFVVRITEADFGPSKRSGNPLITAKWEIVSPDEKEIAGEMYGIAGIQSGPMNHFYWTTKVTDDDEKSENSLDRLVGKGEPLGLLRVMFPDNPEYADQFNPENPDNEVLKKMVGMCLYVQMSPDTQLQRKNPTAQQIADAKAKGIRPEGDVMKNPITGKDLIQYLPKVREIFGVAPSSVGSNKPY